MAYVFESYVLDPARRELRRDGVPVAIEPKAFDLLIHLVAHRDRVVSRDDLVNAVWDGRVISDAALATCVNAARRAVADSGDVQRLIRTLPRKGFRFTGPARDEGAVAAIAPVPPPTWSDRPSIAVLPFENLGADPEQGWFADGMAEDIIAGLGRIPWLLVTARNSSFAYRHRLATDARQIGRELSVRYLLEGSIRRAGARLRVTTSLVDAETGAHLCAERYDRQFGDVFALQDEISMAVVAVMVPSLRRAELERVRRRRPASLDAYELVLRAAPFAHSHIAEDALVAIPMLQAALRYEPGYAAAHAPLALCHHSRFSRAGLQEADRSAAVRHARAAVEHGADDAAALGLAGFVLSLDAHDHAAALEAFDRALALSASDHVALCSSALALSWLGDAGNAIERAERALRVSPHDPLNYLACNALAIAYLQACRYEEAREAARRSVQLNPHFSVSRAFLVAALMGLGQELEARDEARRLLTLDPGFSVRRFAVTVDIRPAVFTPLAEAWSTAGLPKG